MMYVQQTTLMRHESMDRSFVREHTDTDFKTIKKEFVSDNRICIKMTTVKNWRV